ncbi:MAG: hypothetical protein JKY84_06105 [Emcibacteraceae bacterium]|nr:hypothetical protein [Emcibacteraceae bacterium]
MNYIGKIRKNIEKPKLVSVLTEGMMWQNQGDLIWQADKFEGNPCYYPVYQFENYYSYSPLALILKKQCLNVNSKALEKASQEGFIVQDVEHFIDKDINRIGAPHNFTNNICDVDDYCQKIVTALSRI